MSWLQVTNQCDFGDKSLQCDVVVHGLGHCQSNCFDFCHTGTAILLPWMDHSMSKHEHGLRGPGDPKVPGLHLQNIAGT